MTATQSFRIYEILHKHFKNDADAKVIVEEIESIIETKIDNIKDILATKEDIVKSQLEIEKRLNNIIIWIVATGVACAGLVLTILKLFTGK